MSQDSRILAVVFAVTFAMSGAVSLFLFGSVEGMIAAVDVLFDSAGYRALGQSLWVTENIPASRLAQRGYLYPFVAVGLNAVSPLFFILLQMLSVSGAVTILAALERRLTGIVIISPLAILSVSLLISPTFMMTESFALLFSAGAVAILATARRYHCALPFIFAAALIKPAFFPIAFASVILMLPMGRRILIPLGVVILMLTPQILLTLKIGGTVQLSSAGRDNLQERFYPAVAGVNRDGQIVRYRDAQAAVFIAERPELGQQLWFVLSHPTAALKTWGKLITQDHFLQGSGFAQRDNTAARPNRREKLKRLSGWVNLLFVALLVPSIVGVLRYLIAKSPGRWSSALAGPSILAFAPLVYWQGDRVVFIGWLLLLPFAGLGLNWLWITLNGQRFGSR